MSEIELLSPPTDGITSLAYSPSAAGDFLLASAWDSHLRLYDTTANKKLTDINLSAPILDCGFLEDSLAFAGDLKGNVTTVNVDSSQTRVLGYHEKPVKSVRCNVDKGLLLSGSWDGTMKVWDPRLDNACTNTLNQPGKVYSLDTVGNRAVVATSGLQVWVWDLRNMAKPEQERQSSLKYQTRCVRSFPVGDGYVLSSTEGRVSVEYFDISSKVQSHKYAFKCHRVKSDDSVEHVYPVHSITFHPVHGTFATGGGDGFVNMWDGRNRKRLAQLRKFPTSIAASAFNNSGNKLAVASSYAYEEGESLMGRVPDQIFVREMRGKEIEPKKRS